MFDFNNLAIVQPNEPNRYRGSFVGIRKDKYLEKMAFTLPKGFENFESNYENIKNLFFSMYRTFEKFRQSRQKNLDDKPESKDNVQAENQGAYVYIDEDNNEIILYSKIDLIDNILKTYHELEIESIVQQLGIVENVDYSRIEKYLDRGVYLKNNAIYIENTEGYRNVVFGIPSDLIEIFCYIYREIANELTREISGTIHEISFNFSYKHLNSEQSLFSEYTFESTIQILKNCLDDIEKKTAYKSVQYWDVYEAVENFLYGSLDFNSDIDQGFWGINNFSCIWEEMCNYMVAQNKSYKILYCDTAIPLNKYKNNVIKNNRIWIDRNEIENVFYLEFHGYKRWLRPDIIIKPIVTNNDIDNPLNIIIARKLLSIREYQVKSVLSFGVNRLNVDFSFNLSKGTDNSQNSSIIEIAEKIFNLFSKKFSNLYRTKGVLSNSLKGYQYLPNSKYSFSLRNIPKEQYQKIYQDVLNRGNTTEGYINIYITDWKYYSHEVFSKTTYRDNRRINTSIIKSLVYEYCLQQLTDEKIKNQFALPVYQLNCDEVVVDSEKLDCNIELVKMNFTKIQEIYLNE